MKPNTNTSTKRSSAGGVSLKTPLKTPLETLPASTTSSTNTVRQIQTSNNDMSAVAAAHAAQLQATQTGTAVPNSLQRPDYALHDCIAVSINPSCLDVLSRGLITKLQDVRKVCGDVQTRIAALCQSMATVPGVPSSVNDMLNNDLRGVNQQVSTLAFHVRSMERLSEDRTRHIYEERAALITGHETEKLTLRGKLQAYQDRYHKTETELRESQASWVTVEKRRKAEIEKKTEKVMNQKRRIKEQQDQIDVSSFTQPTIAAMVIAGSYTDTIGPHTELEAKVGWPRNARP